MSEPTATVQEQTTQTPAPAAPAAPAQPAPFNKNDLLAVAERVLEAIGKPAHHSEMIAKAQEMGIAGDNINNINPRVWADTRKAEGTGSGKFRFYGRSVFGLNREGWPQLNEYVHAGTTKAPKAAGASNKKLNAEQLTAKVERLTKELAAAQAALEEAKKNPPTETPAPPQPTAAQAAIQAPVAAPAPPPPAPAPTAEPQVKAAAAPTEEPVKVKKSAGIAGQA